MKCCSDHNRGDLWFENHLVQLLLTNFLEIEILSNFLEVEVLPNFLEVEVLHFKKCVHQNNEMFTNWLFIDRRLMLKVMKV